MVERRRVLVVEDDHVLLELLHELLTGAGFEVVDAPDGSSALLKLDKRPDVILLDLRMPVFDGVAFLHTYRGTPEPRAPVICMTAFALPAELPREDVAGVIEKPFAIASVVAAIDRALQQKAA